MTRNQQDPIDTSFWFIHQDGSRLYPSRMTDRDTGTTTFRLSKKSNLKADAQRVTSIEQVAEMVFAKGYDVRMSKRGVGQPASIYGFDKGVVVGWDAEAVMKATINRHLGR